ncbi:hypothetical protein B484DRAFT_407796 [Ochromonadaceae sp. CCMP2298]|nr:hypothetical protein B484DRAFT_407796 [Ochromonadaceae sp. CCMP2298]
MSRYGMIGDVDNSEEIENGMVNIPATEKSYETFVRKFRGYVGFEAKERVPADALNDHNFSNFLLAVGKEHDGKPHFRKAAMAAIGSMLKKHNIDKLFESPHLYRETHRVITRWLCELKINPYYAVGSMAYCAPALAAILQLVNTSPQEQRDSAVVILTCFTSLRIEDVEGMKERMLTIKPANKSHPHHIVVVLDKTKNDKTGQGPVAGRTFVLPCTYHLDMDTEETANFVQRCKSNTKHPCLDVCPYQVVINYQTAKPTSLDASSKGKHVAPGEIFYGRMLSARGKTRSLTTYKLGIKEMRKCVVRVNERLSEEHQLAKPTGHAGRATLVTVAVNEGGVDPTLVAQASKHRNPKTCMGYIRPDEGTLMAAAIGVGRAVREVVADAAAPLLAKVESHEDSNGLLYAMSQKHAKPPKAMANKRFLDTDPESNDEDDEDEENIPRIINSHNTRKLSCEITVRKYLTMRNFLTIFSP